MLLGAHESAAGGPHTAVGRAVDDGCECLQIFVKNNNRWSQRPWTDEEIDRFRNDWADSGLQRLVAHAAYLINPCSANPSVRAKSREALADEMDRCAQLGVEGLVLHPGAPGDGGEAWGLATVAEEINALWAEHGERWGGVTLLFENTAGQGSCLGWRHEHLRDLFARLDQPERFGVCFDTCHAHAAGYDLRDPEGYEAHWEVFDAVVGLDRLRAFHLNDSKKALGTRVDRHEHIAEGELGSTVFEQLLADPRFEGLPGILETPPLEDASSGYRRNLATLRSYLPGR